MTMKMNRVKELAKARGMTQFDLALAVKDVTSLRSIQRLWQNSPHAPSPQTLEAVAKALNVTVDELFVSSDESDRATLAGNRKSLAPALG